MNKCNKTILLALLLGAGGAHAEPGGTVHTTTVSGSTDTGKRFFRQIEPSSRTIRVTTPANAPLSFSVAPLFSIPALAAEPALGQAFFQAPSLFSAPLPTGSGARALGVAGAFSAVADDATAASWNPAGLLNLETAEASLVYRHTSIRNRHHSDDPNLEVGEDRYGEDALNYLSLVQPFRMPGTGWNAVFSLNHQESYDFTHAFHSTTRDHDTRTLRRRTEGVARATQTDRFLFEGGVTDVTLTSDLTTRSVSELTQTIRSDFEGRLRFRQQGSIEATTPALAVAITPRFFVGGALNLHQESPFAGRGVQSRARVDYRTRTDSRAVITNTQSTGGSYTLDTVLHVPFPPYPDLVLPSTSGTLPGFTDREVLRPSAIRTTEGTYEEVNRYEGWEGVNGTFGLMFGVNRHLTLGASADLPWTADATQNRSVRHEVVSRDGSGTERSRQVRTESRSTEVGFDFPLFWTVGAALHWNANCVTSLDAGRTHWSDFAFHADGVRLNPLDGGATGDGRVDDTWTLRLGTEYAWMFGRAAVPVRAGLVREERPAVGNPDVYHGFSLGTGVRFQRCWFDLAYGFIKADDVQTVLPANPALRTDTEQHQVFASVVVHF